jgi:soluble lytic murein transglycosylase-like protein
MKQGGSTAAGRLVRATAASVFANRLSAVLLLSLLLGSSVQSPAQPIAAAAPSVQVTVQGSQAESKAPPESQTSNTRPAGAAADGNAQPAEAAAGQASAHTVPVTHSTAICSILEEVAHENALPLNFFARLIWQESHFRPDSVGPMTRYGQRAEGIAQFMPATAVARGLLDPFDPRQALPKSGEFLAQLRDEFGNLGLAAAAYNGGPQRVRDFLSGARGLPEETRHYVFAITGHRIEDWVGPARQAAAEPPQVPDTMANCDDLAALLKHPAPLQLALAHGTAPAIMHASLTTVMPSSTQVSQRPVPSWCGGLHHPNASICGTVRARAPLPILAHSLRPRHHRAGMIQTSSR